MHFRYLDARQLWCVTCKKPGHLKNRRASLESIHGRKAAGELFQVQLKAVTSFGWHFQRETGSVEFTKLRRNE